MKQLTHNIIDHERTIFFDQLAETWDTSGPPPETTIVEAFLHKLNFQPGGTILDAGTGTGMLIPYLFQYDPAKVYALDLSRIMLSKLAQKFENQFGDKLVIVQGDVHCLEFADHSIDAAICNGVYPHFHDKTLALAELYRVLKPGGVLAINHFAGKDFINSIHSGISHELIRQDLLEPVADLAHQVRQAGFLVREMADNEAEYYLIGWKP
ncbi:MAG: class I SAM-dependent methyltransferase [Firmicutes bacterium]|nr:class I SAM-dependent methyltransferase [Bacillota bacterium]